MRSLLLLLFVLAMSSLKAQTDSSFVPLKDQKYITLGVLGNSKFIHYRTYWSDATAIRIGLDAQLDEYEDKTDYLDFPDATVKYRNLHANLNLGIQTKLLRLPKLETYVGVDASIGVSNFVRETETTRLKYDVATDAFAFDYQIQESKKGGYLTPALRPFIGANFYVYKGLSIGVEYRIPLIARYYQISNVYSVVYKDILGQTITPPTNVNPNATSTNTYTNSHYGLVGNTTVTVGFRIR